MPLTALTIAAAAMISACGGGGSSAGPTTLSGAVIDGYIRGATVCLDLNSNNLCDTGEPSTISGDNGAYSLTVPAGADLSGLHILANIPTTATDNGATITAPYKMLAPASMPTVVSPLTTAVSIEMKTNGLNVANARIAARSDLALPIDYDFLKDHIAKADVTAGNVAKVMAAVLANAVGSAPLSNTSLGVALATIKANAANITPSTVAGLISSLGPQGSGTGTGTSAALVSFDAAGVTYTLSDFGGAASSKVTGPAGSNGLVAQVVKGSAGAPSETWAGTTMSTGANQSIGTVPFTSTAKTMTVRVYSPTIGTPVRLKLEDAADATHTVETEVNTTAVGWQTLTFNFANPATGTAALNLAYTFNKASIFMNFGTAGTGQTYYFDDLMFTP